MAKKGIEIRMGESRYYLGEDNIIHAIEVGEVNDQKAMAIKEAYFKDILKNVDR